MNVVMSARVSSLLWDMRAIIPTGRYDCAMDESVDHDDAHAHARRGPLAGIRVLELGGLGPGPFAAMVLADLGATVLRIDRPGHPATVAGARPERDVLLRGRPSAMVDLKRAEGRELIVALAREADALIDPFRPGVAERLDIGPQQLLDGNPRLIYGRITGWGQDGPWASAAGHDINYVALAGPLAAMGRAGSPPAPPLNLVGDFGGGGMLLVTGILAALVERAASGRGQVVDAAMVDGAALLLACIVGFRQMGIWTDQRESNLLDGGSPFYDTYETADARYVAVGAVEPQFYDELLRRIGLDPGEWPQHNRARWPALRARLTEIFRSRTRDEWDAVLGGTDACYAPVLDVDEAAAHPQNRQRGVYRHVEGLLQPAPAPRFSRTPGELDMPPSPPGHGGHAALLDWGVPRADLDRLEHSGTLVLPASAKTPTR